MNLTIDSGTIDKTNKVDKKQRNKEKKMEENLNNL